MAAERTLREFVPPRHLRYNSHMPERTTPPSTQPGEVHLDPFTHPLNYATPRPATQPVPQRALVTASIAGAAIGLVMAWLSVVGAFHRNNILLWAIAGGPAAILALPGSSPLAYFLIMGIAIPAQYACYAWLLVRHRGHRNTLICLAAAHAAGAAILLAMAFTR